MFIVRLSAAFLVLVATAFADVATGSSRDEVIDQWGPPKARAAAGAREIFTYPAGRVILENGVVTQLDFKGPPPPTVEAGLPPPPDPVPTRPPTRSEPTGSRSTVSIVPGGPAVASELWFTNFEAAKAEAKAKNKKILALFTGSDWCPPCMDFESKVATSREFLAAVTPKLVLLKLDYPRNKTLPDAERAQNQKLQREFSITSYPTFKILDATGAEQTTLRTTGTRQASSIQQYFIQAVEEGLADETGLGLGPEPLKDWRVIGAGVLVVMFALGKYWGRQRG